MFNLKTKYEHSICCHPERLPVDAQGGNLCNRLLIFNQFKSYLAPIVANYHVVRKAGTWIYS